MSTPFNVYRLVLAAAAAFLVWHAADALLMVFAGLLFAVLLRSIADLIRRIVRVPEWLALAVAGLLLLGSIVAFVVLFAPSVAAQADELTKTLPDAVRALRDRLAERGWGRVVLRTVTQGGQGLPDAREAVTRIGGVFSGVFGAVGSAIVVVFTGIFLAANPTLYLDGVVALVRPERRADVRDALVAAGETLRAWLLGQLAAMILIGVLTGVGLRLLGIPLAFLLGVLAAVLAFIPNFGPIVAAIPGVLLALLDGPTRALQVIGVYFAAQTIESYLFTPIVQRKTVDLPPALTLAAQAVIGALFGAVGLALATPMAAVALVLIRRLHIRPQPSTVFTP